MLRVVLIVYLLSLASGLLLLALDRTFPAPAKKNAAGTPAEAPLLEAAGAETLFAHFSLLLAGIGVAALGLFQRLKKLGGH